MNAGIRARLRAVLNEIVAILTEIPVEAAEGIAPELSGYFLALTGRNRGRGERCVPLETDGITVSVGWVVIPCEVVSPGNLRSVRSGVAVVDGDRVCFGFRTFPGIAAATVATEDPNERHG